VVRLSTTTTLSRLGGPWSSAMDEKFFSVTIGGSPWVGDPGSGHHVTRKRKTQRK
jgi:hypothetical protein